MATNIKVTFDESALGRVYLWLLSLNDETLPADRSGIEKTSEVNVNTLTQTLSDETPPKVDTLA